MTVDRVDTLVDRGVHLQPTVFHGEIRLVDRVDTYSGKDCWGSETATRPVAGRGQTQQWGKGIHPIHPADKGNDYSALPVDAASRRYPPCSLDERSRRYHCYRSYCGGSLLRNSHAEGADPSIRLPTEKSETKTRLLPLLPRG